MVTFVYDSFQQGATCAKDWHILNTLGGSSYLC